MLTVDVGVLLVAGTALVGTAPAEDVPLATTGADEAVFFSSARDTRRLSFSAMPSPLFLPRVFSATGAAGAAGAGAAVGAAVDLAAGAVSGTTTGWAAVVVKGAADESVAAGLASLVDDDDVTVSLTLSATLAMPDGALLSLFAAVDVAAGVAAVLAAIAGVDLTAEVSFDGSVILIGATAVPSAGYRGPL